jgi:hypothetical protein
MIKRRKVGKQPGGSLGGRSEPAGLLWSLGYWH